MVIYETQKDRDRQSEVAEFVAGLMGLRAVDTSTTSPIDFELYVGDILQGVMEVKCRNVRFGTYEDYRIDKSKIDKVHNIADERSCIGLIAVRCTDKIALSGTKNFIHHSSVDKIARYDRNDRNDSDVAYCMPWDRFQKVLPIEMMETHMTGES